MVGLGVLTKSQCHTAKKRSIFYHHVKTSLHLREKMLGKSVSHTCTNYMYHIYNLAKKHFCGWYSGGTHNNQHSSCIHGCIHLSRYSL